MSLIQNISGTLRIHNEQINRADAELEKLTGDVMTLHRKAERQESAAAVLSVELEVLRRRVESLECLERQQRKGWWRRLWDR